MSEFYTLVTDIGRQKIANAAVTGTSVEIVEFAIGDGGGSPITPSESMTSLINEVWRGNISKYDVDGNIISVRAVVPADTGDWTGREMGLFDTDGDMIAIANMPEAPKTIPDSGAGTEFTFEMRILVESTDNITVVIDPSADYVTITQLETIIVGIKDEIENHTHDAKDITSGILTVPRGGTGANSITENQVVIGKGDKAFVGTEPTNAGALYRTGEKEMPQFNTLPVKFGGTGAKAFTTDFPLFGDGEDALKALKPQLAMAKLGYAYGVCNTAAATTAKTVAIEGYVLFTGSHAFVKFTYDVPANATLNINGTGAKAIYIGSYAIIADLIKEGDTAEFVYNGSQWVFVSIANIREATGTYTTTGTSTLIEIGFEPKALFLTFSRTDASAYYIYIGKRGGKMDGINFTGLSNNGTTLTTTNAGFYSKESSAGKTYTVTYTAIG